MLHNVKKPCWSTCIVSLSWPPNQSAFEPPEKNLEMLKRIELQLFCGLLKLSKSKKFSESIGHRKNLEHFARCYKQYIISYGKKFVALSLEKRNSNYSGGPSKNQTLPRLKSNTLFWLGSLGSGGLWIFYLGGKKLAWFY